MVSLPSPLLRPPSFSSAVFFKSPLPSRLFGRSDECLAIGKRLHPFVDANTGPQPVHPEWIVLKDLAHFLFTLRLDNPQSTERLIRRDFANRSGNEHFVFLAIQKSEMFCQEFLA